ncbi:MAG: galactose oxidase [Candidatus Eremiobacteraeota bacterium]|nr:galactose oxidase [Candidatus Eremiobacteraeota bacterium]
MKAVAAAVVLIAAASLQRGWNAGPPLSVGRSEVAVATVGGALYVIGGYANGNVDQTLVQKFTPDVRDDRLGGKWQDVAPLPRGLNHVGALGYHGKIYTFGGFAAQNNSAVPDANVYDPKADRWTPVAPLPRPLGSVSVALFNDEIHLVGGRDVHSVATHLMYDARANRYIVRAPLPVGRDHMGLVEFNGKLYAVGGRIDTPARNTAYVDVYDNKTDRWTAAAPLPAPRSGMAVAVFTQRIWAMGGEQAGMSSAFSTVFAYDDRRNCWMPFGVLPEGRHGTGAAVIGDLLYVPAGAPVPGGSRQSDSLFVFRPMTIGR